MKLLVLCYLTAAAVASPPQNEDQDSTQSSQDDVTELPTTTLQDEPDEMFDEIANNTLTPQYYYVHDGTGNYTFGFEERGGIKFQTRGVIMNMGTKDEYIAIEGLFEWFHGAKQSIGYVIGKNGSAMFTDNSPFFH